MSGNRIKEYRVKSNGAISIVFPQTFMEDAGIKPGDKVDIFQTLDGRLIIQPKGYKPAPTGASA